MTCMGFGEEGLGFGGIKIKTFPECFHFIPDYLQKGFKVAFLPVMIVRLSKKIVLFERLA